MAVALACWLAVGRVLGSDPRFIVLAAPAWALSGTVLTSSSISERRGESPGRVVDSGQAGKTAPEVRDGTVIEFSQRGLETELERSSCRNRLQPEVREGGLCRISCATPRGCGAGEDLERALPSMPTGAGKRSIRGGLFDHPEIPARVPGSRSGSDRDATGSTG